MASLRRGKPHLITCVPSTANRTQVTWEEWALVKRKGAWGAVQGYENSFTFPKSSPVATSSCGGGGVVGRGSIDKPTRGHTWAQTHARSLGPMTSHDTTRVGTIDRTGVSRQPPTHIHSSRKKSQGNPPRGGRGTAYSSIARAQPPARFPSQAHTGATGCSTHTHPVRAPRHAVDVRKVDLRGPDALHATPIHEHTHSLPRARSHAHTRKTTHRAVYCKNRAGIAGLAPASMRPSRSVQEVGRCGDDGMAQRERGRGWGSGG